MRLDDGWNQIQFNLADFTRRAYGTNYVETLRVQESIMSRDMSSSFFTKSTVSGRRMTHRKWLVWPSAALYSISSRAFCSRPEYIDVV